MPLRKYSFVDPKFNEFLYDVLVNLTPSQRERLSPFLAAKIRTRTAIKRFVNGESLEQKMAILTSIGFEASLLVYRPENFDPETVKKVYKQNAMNGTPVENITEMIRNKFFVVTSKDIAQALVLMNHNCHGDSYYINQDFLKVRKAVGVTKHISLSEKNVARQTKDAMQAFREVCRLMLVAYGVPSYLSGKSDLRPVDMAILLILAMFPNNYVSVNFIRRNLSHSYKEAVINRTLGELMRVHKYVDRLPKSEDDKSYRITAEGLLVLGRIVNHCVNTELE